MPSGTTAVPQWGVRWRAGFGSAPSSGTDYAGWPYRGAITNNAILNGAAASFTIGGISLQNVGPFEVGGDPPVITVNNNLLLPTVSAGNPGRQKIQLVWSDASAPPPPVAAPFYIDASNNAFRTTSDTEIVGLGPSSVTVTGGYTDYPDLGADVGIANGDTATAADRIKQWPWILTYTYDANAVGFTPVDVATASGDPHFTGFDVSC